MGWDFTDSVKYPAAMSGVLILAAIVAQQQACRAFYAFYAFLCLSRINILAHDPHGLIIAELAAVD
ncbi:MAG: hypothetical protein ACLTSZ_07010 [Lachnospiraceae bacterium]